MTLILALKLAIILIFLILFLRRPSFSWGIGLLTVTTALLLDSLFGTVANQELQTEFGFFYFVTAGALFGGAAIWLIGILLPYINPNKALGSVQSYRPLNANQGVVKSKGNTKRDGAYDRQMVFEVIQQRFGREDVLDLMFDLGIQENEVMTIDQDMNKLIVNIMDNAEAKGQAGALALAVERILTPLPPEHLPRLQKLSADSPPTILRQYLLLNYSLEAIQDMAAELDIDWEQLDAGAKREKTRSILQYLYRRNRMEDLIALMQGDLGVKEVEIEFDGPETS